MKFKELSGWVQVAMLVFVVAVVCIAPVASGRATRAGINNGVKFVTSALGGDPEQPPGQQVRIKLPSPQDGPPATRGQG